MNIKVAAYVMAYLHYYTWLFLNFRLKCYMWFIFLDISIKELYNFSEVVANNYNDCYNGEE